MYRKGSGLGETAVYFLPGAAVRAIVNFLGRRLVRECSVSASVESGTDHRVQAAAGRIR